MALTDIQKVRLEIADNDPALPVLSDEEVGYYLEKHSNSISRAAIDCAKTIMFKLSMNAGEQRVDIFSISGKEASMAYIAALKLYISNPNINGIFNNMNVYIAGTSVSDMQANIDNTDNNIVLIPNSSPNNTIPIPENGWVST